MLKKLIKGVEKFRIKGQVAPSSKYLVNKMVSKIDFRYDVDVLQLGFGTGVFSKEILKRMTPTSTLIVFEVDKECRQYKIDDNRLVYFEDSAENITKHFQEKKFDHIISTLPFASLPKEVSKNIFVEITQHIKKNGTFLQYQYSLFSKKDIANLFNSKLQVSFVPLNIPPAFIYQAQND